MLCRCQVWFVLGMPLAVQVPSTSQMPVTIWINLVKRRVPRIHRRNRLAYNLISHAKGVSCKTGETVWFLDTGLVRFLGTVYFSTDIVVLSMH